ncbi:MAG: hypothetical protein Q4E41_10690 [Bacteroidales bacterium]|nr:hypothetical protein [Bacteroidales bacterium]
MDQNNGGFWSKSELKNGVSGVSGVSRVSGDSVNSEETDICYNNGIYLFGIVPF